MPANRAAHAERAKLRLTADRLLAGTSTLVARAALRAATGYFVLAGSPEGRVRALFDDFLSRAAEADEIENGRAMVSSDGFLTTRRSRCCSTATARRYADLIDIVFDERDLSRGDGPPRVRALPRAHADVDRARALHAHPGCTDPDMRPLVRAVVSSREYFEQ